MENMRYKHVVSLEMSKKLKDAGWEKKTYFTHRTWKNFKEEFCHGVVGSNYERLGDNVGVRYILAPLVSEILEELSNNEIMDYCNRNEKMTQGEFINLFREPDLQAEIWLEKKRRY